MVAHFLAWSSFLLYTGIFMREYVVASFFIIILFLLLVLLCWLWKYCQILHGEL